MQPYRHERLESPDSIRILDLLPARKWDAPVECRIRQTTVEKACDKYEALSYVWGALEGDRPIGCNGRELLITPNCHDAIIHLRRRFRVRTLWIDSICIDQRKTSDSIQERNHQIKQMGMLYQNASRVLIWLGPNNTGLTANTNRLLKLRSHTDRLKLPYKLWNMILCQRWCQSCTEMLQSPEQMAYGDSESLRRAGQRAVTISLYGSAIGSSWWDLMLYPNCSELSPAGVRDSARQHNPALFESSQQSPSDIILGYLESEESKFESLTRDIQWRANKLVNWAFLVTGSGYLGRAYRTCQEGDQLWLLAGAANPVILRQSGSEYRFVAPAFFDGMMDGELWSDNEEELELLILI
ncbi:hypothetical protein PG997_014343 [Apiospora hydei]|uniref:Heterokaryon incompatibility domain-containing protein n=1 Tax=Apiospora hydei TaxID=1337664 RepID=A0ABR1UTI6_9PEZI